MVSKINVEVWLAAAALHDAGKPAFSAQELAAQVERMFGDTRPGVLTHITAHCVANSRAAGRAHPGQADVPPAHLALYRKWTSSPSR